MPGGVGTLEELFEILSWRTLALHAKPMVVVEGDGYWDPLLAMFGDMKGEGFIRPGLELNLEVVDQVDAIIPAVMRALVPREERAEAEEEAKVAAKF